MKKAVKLIEKILSVLLVYSILIVFVIAVASRYVFNRPILWAEPLVMLLFTWMIFIGAAFGYLKKEMITMDIFSDRFPQKIKIIMDIMLDIIIVAASIYLIPSGIKLIQAFKNVDLAGLPLTQDFIFSVSLIVIILFAIIGLYKLIYRISYIWRKR